jgi:hypothetical protein
VACVMCFGSCEEQDRIVEEYEANSLLDFMFCCSAFQSLTRLSIATISRRGSLSPDRLAVPYINSACFKRGCFCS